MQPFHLLVESITFVPYSMVGRYIVKVPCICIARSAFSNFYLMLILLDSARMLNNDFDNLNVTDKLKMLLNTMWKDSSRFVLEAWTIRHNLLYVDWIKYSPVVPLLSLAIISGQ